MTTGFRYNGTPNKDLVANVKKAYEVEKMSGKASKTFFCLNQCDKDDGQTTFDDAFKKNFVDKIYEAIEKSNFITEDIDDSLKAFLKSPENQEFASKLMKKSEELKGYTLNNLKTDDFLFTDWKNYGHRCIMGPKDIEIRIQQYVSSMSVN